MFLQETKTKRGGKTYISYLVRESFRTANGPRGRTICNLTHLPKEVRDMVGQALKGESLVPLDRLEVNNIHSFGGCVVLEDASKRYGLAELLGPLPPRSGALVRAMIFGGLLTAPSVAPFYVEARTARLAMYCGLDADKERFDTADLTVALRELDEQWAQVCALLIQPAQLEIKAITLFHTARSGSHNEMGALGMDAKGIPVPLLWEDSQNTKEGLTGLLQQMAEQSKTGAPLLMLDEEIASRMKVDAMEGQPYLIELGPESVAALLKQLNQAQLAHALRTGGPVEVRHHGQRYILAPEEGFQAAETQEKMRMGSLNELTSITANKAAEGTVTPKAIQGGIGGLGGFHCVSTNASLEKLPAQTAMDWAQRARTTRGAFSPIQIVMGRSTSGEGVLTWRNHQNLQLLTHWLRCHLHSEWCALGETRPVEDVLRELQEVHRATITVDGVVMRRLSTRPSKNLAALLSRLKLWDLFETPECEKKSRS